MVAVTLVPLLPTHWRFIRSGDSPRVQILVFAGVVLLWVNGLAELWGRILLSLIVVPILIQLRYILLYTQLVSPDSLRMSDVSEHRRVRVIVANVLQDNDDYEALIRKVRWVKPDPLFTVETNQRWVDERTFCPIPPHGRSRTTTAWCCARASN